MLFFANHNVHATHAHCDWRWTESPPNFSLLFPPANRDKYSELRNDTPLPHKHASLAPNTKAGFMTNQAITGTGNYQWKI